MRKKFSGENNSLKSRSNSGSSPSFNKNKSSFNRNKSNNDRSKRSSFGNKPSFNKNNSSNNNSSGKFKKRRFEKEDEEIDSDEAFNSQDDIKYGDIFDKKNKKKKGKQGNAEEKDKNGKNNKKKIDIEESYDESDDDGLDGGEELDNDGSDDGKFVTLTDILDSDNDDGYKFDDDDDDNDNDDLEFDSEDEKSLKSNASSNHDNFLDQLKGMLGMKKKKIKGSLKEEGEYKKNPYDENHNLQLEDLVNPLNKNKDLQSKIDSIKQDIEKLKSSRPTAQPLEEEDLKNINRDISYKQVKNKVNKWEQVIDQNRESGLVFGKSKPNQISINNLEIKDGDSKLKNTIQNILRQSGIDEQQIKEYEDLTKNETTLEQLREREKELKKLRSIMFFEELKAKRQKKIKSKKYRKILRRKREKNEEEQMDEEDIERERVKAEKERALERARLRHSSSSNWTKRMLRTGLKKEVEIKDQIKQQRDLAKSLKKRMGVEDSEEESLDSEEQEQEAVENQKDGVSGMLFMQRALEKEKRHAEDLKEDLERMENPKKKEKKIEHHDIIAKHKATIQKKQKEGNKNSGNNNVSEDFGSHTVSHKTSFKGNLEVDTNNKKYNKSLEFMVTDFPETDDKEERREIDDFSKILNKTQIKLHQKTAPQSVTNNKESNGEKEEESSESSESDEDEGDINHFVNHNDNNEEENDSVVENLDSSENDNKNNFSSDDDDEEGEGNNEDDVKLKMIQLQDDDSDSESAIQITNNPWIAKDKKESKEKSEKKKLKEKRNEEKMRITETKELYSEPKKNSKKDLSMFNLLESNNANQKEIVEQAFAVDDVAEEFEIERNQVLNENVVEEKEEELAGWGSWAGDGVKNQKRKRKVDPLTKAKQQQKKAKENELQELHKENKKVIINNLALPSETSKLLISQLPHPYNSLQEYEVGMGRPVGSEFNTRSMFKQFIQPDVKVYDGSVIKPIEWDSKKMEKKKQEQNNNNNNQNKKKKFNNKNNTPNKNLPKNLKNKK